MGDRKHIFKPADKQYMGHMVCVEVLANQAKASGPLNASNAYWVGAVLVERNNSWYWMMTKGTGEPPLLSPADVAAMQEVAQQVIEAQDEAREKAHFAADRA